MVVFALILAPSKLSSYNSKQAFFIVQFLYSVVSIFIDFPALIYVLPRMMKSTGAGARLIFPGESVSNSFL